MLRIVDPLRLWGFLRFDKKIFLTFDDGPNPEITPWVLDFLKEKNIKATFFCVGENVQRYPDLFQRIKDEGHQVGNHTFKHLNGKKVSNADYFSSVELADALIQSKLFRPPYGRMRFSQAKYLRKQQYKIVMWSWLSYDFDLTFSDERILKKAQRRLRSGDIVVMHDNQKLAARQRVLLPRLIEVIQNKGLQFDVLS